MAGARDSAENVLYRSGMTSTLPKKFEAFAVPGGLKGQLADLSVPEILQQLGALGATGILTLVAGGRARPST